VSPVYQQTEHIYLPPCPRYYVLDTSHVPDTNPSTSLPPHSLNSPIAINIEALPNDSPPPKSIQRKVSKPCEGFLLRFPPGQSSFGDYPIGLHMKQSLPFEIASIPANGTTMILRSVTCSGLASCTSCTELSENCHVKGIMKRMETGVREGSNLPYYGINGLYEIIHRKDTQIDNLRLGKLTTARVLSSKSATIDDWKRLYLALASGKVRNCERLLRVAVNHKRGVRGALQMYADAAMKHYQPRNTDEQSVLMAIVLWRLGGARVAEFAHRAMNLPGLTTLRRYSTMQPIIASYRFPTMSDVERNLHAVLSDDLLDTLRQISHSRSLLVQLLIDEIATEKRLRYDPKTNRILGVCREHSSEISVTFDSVEVLEELMKALDDGRVHYASEVGAVISHVKHLLTSTSCQATVAALGFLTPNKRLYSARPVLLSGTCKREDGHRHFELLQLVIRAINNKFTSLAAESGSPPSQVISIASDGEARRGRALVELAMHSNLPPSSKLYELLAPLRYMNLLIGENELTADKDFKHVMKRIRCKEIRPSGIAVFDQILTPSTIQLHLRDAGHGKQHIDATFRPDDKQDVVLAVSSLQDIISLPPAPETKPAGFRDTRNALIILGQTFKYLLHPYICVDFSLSEQLEYLSAAAHLILLLYRANKSKFFPTLLYTDIMIMIKNVYFSVAKAKITDPMGQFFLILLGTDRLEILFGIIRSMIGNDCGADLLQLGERVTGTAQVAEILAAHPEWDRSPRRLRLPVIDRDGKITTLSNDADHVSPASWRGNVSTATVNLHTSWRRGLSLLEQNPVLQSIRTEVHELQDLTDTIDILSPFGTLLVNPESHNDESDDDDEERADIISVRCRVQVPDRLEGAGSSVDLEDGVAAEESTPGERQRDWLTHIKMPNGEKVNKARLLSRFMQNRKNPSSADRLKRYQNISRFESSAGFKDVEARFVVQDDELALAIGDPIVSLLQCEDHPFLCFGEVLSIAVDSEPIDQIPITMTSDLLVMITYQLIKLEPVTTEDDPNSKHDWRSRHGASTGMEPFQKTVPGRLIQTINPELSEPKPHKEGFVRERPFYLLDSQSLIALTASFTNRLGSEDAKSIPCIARSRHFPYTKAGEDLTIAKYDIIVLILLSERACLLYSRSEL
jgi:hypothetical protein